MDAVLATAQRTFEAATLGQSELFGGPAAPEKLVLPDVATWLPAERLQREYDAIGFFLSGHPLDDYAGVLKSMRVPSWAEFSRQVKSGVTAGKVAATVVSRAERRTKTGNKMGIIGLSDPSGHYEAVIFAEGLQQYRDLLEPGSPVLLHLTAEAQGEEVRARIQTVEPLDRAAAKVQKGLRIFLRDVAPLDAVAKRLDGKGDGSGQGSGQGSGEVNLVMLLDAGAEVEVKLPGRYKVSPQIAGAIKAVPGVVEVQAV
jgi:DNA polymerase-3 subunit alpha